MGTPGAFVAGSVLTGASDGAPLRGEALAAPTVFSPGTVVWDADGTITYAGPADGAPTSGLDVVSTRALRRLLQHLRASGKCVVISTHIMQEVDQLADEIVIVAHGRNVAHGDAAAICAQAGAATLEDAFVSLAYQERA